MKRISFRKVLPWLIVAVVIGFVVYRLKFSPTPVTAQIVATGEVRGEVMGTGTLEARVKTTISPRIQERLAEVLQAAGQLSDLHRVPLIHHGLHLHHGWPVPHL